MARVYSFLLTITLFLLVFVGFFHRVTAFTQDLGRHILLGNLILTTHEVPSTNLFSYTYPNYPFLNHHWLSEVLFSFLYAHTGSVGLLVLTTLLALISFGLIFHYAFKNAPFAAIIASLLLIPIFFERTDIRPEIFSFVLFSFFIVTLYKYREKQTKILYILPLLIIAWVNLHIYFFTGLIMIVLFLIDGILKSRRNIWCTYTKRLFYVLLLSTAATLINPHFLKGALYPLGALKDYGYTIEENQTIFFLESLGFHKQSIDFFKVSVILLLIALILNFKKAKVVDWLIAAAFAVAGALAIRNLPLFALSALIPLSSNLSDLFHVFSKKLSDISEKKRLILLHAAYVILFLAGGWETLSIAQKNEFGDKIDPGATKAVDFFEKEHLTGPIFNNFDIGSYLEYRLYPKQKVFIDGRPEAYPASFFQQTYIPMQENQSIFSKIDEHYHFNTIFFSHTDQTPWALSFLTTILQNPHWVPIYLDQTVIIFIKNSPENISLIQHFGMKPSQLHATYDASDLRSLLQLASFSSKINDQNGTFHYASQILALSPTNCQALYIRAAIALSRNDPLSQAYTLMYGKSCNNKNISQ